MFGEPFLVPYLESHHVFHSTYMHILVFQCIPKGLEVVGSLPSFPKELFDFWKGTAETDREWMDAHPTLNGAEDFEKILPTI